MKASKEVKDLLKEAERQGWSVEHGRKHWKLKAPSGKGIVVIAVSPSCIRSLKNSVAEMRRVGFVAKRPKN